MLQHGNELVESIFESITPLQGGTPQTFDPKCGRPAEYLIKYKNGEKVKLCHSCTQFLVDKDKARIEAFLPKKEEVINKQEVKKSEVKK